MKATAAFFVAFCLSIQAQPGEAKPPKQDKKPFERDEKKARQFVDGWQEIDQNKDGKLSKEEFFSLKRISQIPADKQQKLFERLDKNADGFIQREELARGPMGPDGPNGPDSGQKHRPFPHLAQLDTNQDKKISFEEFSKSPGIARLPQERQKMIFENMDRDQDGFLSPKDRPEGPPRTMPPGHRDMPNQRPQQQPSAPHNQRFIFSQADANKDGKVDFTEFQATPLVKHLGEDAQEDRFEEIDTNDDLNLSADEWNQQSLRKPAKVTPKHPAEKKQPAQEPSDDEMMMEDS